MARIAAERKYICIQDFTADHGQEFVKGQIYDVLLNEEESILFSKNRDEIPICLKCLNSNFEEMPEQN